MAVINARMRVLQDSAENFVFSNPILMTGEWGYETDTQKMKIGDGITGWNSLEYKAESPFTAEEKAKLLLIEDLADVTDSENVEAAMASINAAALQDIESSGANIEDSVSKRHTQGTDTTLGAQTQNLDMNSHKIVGVLDPEDPQDATTKNYVDTLIAAGLHWLDAVLDKDTLTPPGAPTSGDRYWIGGTGLGDWATHDYNVAEWNGSAWVFTDTVEGDAAYVEDEGAFYVLNGAGTLTNFGVATMGAHAASHTNGDDDIQSATSGQKGLMSAADKAKLDGYPEVLSLMGAYGVRWLKTATSPVLQKGIVVGGEFVLWDYQDFPVQQTMRRCVLAHNTAEFQYYLHPNDSTKKADGTDANIDGTDGQVQVQTEEFQHLICDDGDYKYMLVGKFPFHLTVGANTYYSTLHPWFMEGGVHSQYKYVAAFEGVLKQAVTAELMPNLVDRDFSGASAWANVDIDAYDETGDLTITASAADQYCTLPVASAPMVAGRKYTLAFSVANLVSTWIIKSYDGTQTIGTVDAAGAQSFEFVAATGGLRIVAGALDSSGDFDDFTLIRPAAYVDGTGAQTKLTGDLIHSVYGHTPLTYFTRTERRQSRDGEFHEFSIAAEEAIILLYLTEYATWYSQSALPGYTEGGAWDFAKACKTGITAGLGNNSGSVTYAEDQAKNALCSYDWSGTPTIVVANSFRGIENFFGHLWKWVDGVNINFIGAPLTDAEVYVCNNPDQFADDTVTNYTHVTDQDGAAIDLPLTSSYQSALHNGLLWPSGVAGGSDTYITDYFYASSAAGWRALRSGGALASGTDAGVAYRSALNAASARHAYVGGRSAA